MDSKTHDKPAIHRSVMILAAGQGTRMKSRTPKVLHAVAGRPMIVHAIQTARSVSPETLVVVIGHGREAVESVVRAQSGEDVRFAVQSEARGTADAVRAGMPAIPASATEVVITYGDVPALPPEALETLCRARTEAGVAVALLTCIMRPPTGYGRILRDRAGRPLAIREDKDCSAEEKAIDEINAGIYAVDAAFLRASLDRIDAGNAQREFYLTDLVSLAHAGPGVVTVPWDAEDLRGVNDRTDLARCDTHLRTRIADTHRRAGVTVDPSARIDAGIQIGMDTTVGPGVVLRGRTQIGAGARIDAGCVLEDATIGDGALLKPYSLVTHSTLGANVQIGPFAHIRPGSHVEDDAHVGNFVELKNTQMAKGSKANHLAYVGDGTIGPGANIGAGTIFCNYDGIRKHRTTIGANAFVGSNSSLVAPVTIGEGSYVASGSVVTESVPDDALAVARARQVNKDGYASRLRRLKKGS